MIFIFQNAESQRIESHELRNDLLNLMQNPKFGMNPKFFSTLFSRQKKTLQLPRFFLFGTRFCVDNVSPGYLPALQIMMSEWL
jgi:hypothetical protein